jgi:hypothetical protein
VVLAFKGASLISFYKGVQLFQHFRGHRSSLFTKAFNFFSISGGIAHLFLQRRSTFSAAVVASKSGINSTSLWDASQLHVCTFNKRYELL